MDKKSILGIVVIIAVALVIGQFLPSSTKPAQTAVPGQAQTVETVRFSDLNKALSDDPKSIQKLTFVNGKNEVIVERTGKPPVTVQVPDASKEYLITKATSADVSVDAKPQEEKKTTGWEMFLAVVINFLPLILIFLVIMWMIRRSQQGPGSIQQQIARAGTKKLEPSADKKTFADVAGCDEAKLELMEVVEYLKDPGLLARLGGRAPNGVLLIGPPGNGKTLLAKAVAGEADAAFFPISASQFVEMFVGVGASRVRTLFDEARKNKPAIIFIDEIDAVGRQRGAGIGGGHDEREQTLNQLLVEMDGFNAKDGIILMAATNRPDILDPALIRPGRFDRQILVDHADIDGRDRIFVIHTRNKPVATDVNTRRLAELTPAFSGAEIEGACNEAATVAARRIKDGIVEKRIQAVNRLLAELCDAGNADQAAALVAKTVVATLRTGGKRGEPFINALAAKLEGADKQAAIGEVLAQLSSSAQEHEQVMRALLAAFPNGSRIELDIRGLFPEVSTMADFVEGIDRVRMGVARTSRAKSMSDEDMDNTAVHELGHALLSEIVKGGDPVSKITIMPRSRALGYTQSLPTGDRFNYTREQLLAMIIMAMGGRAAQEVLLNTVDTGASNDFKQGENIARKMVTEFGMSKLGPISVGSESNPFLGRSMAMSSGVGPELADKIDREYQCIVNSCMSFAKSKMEEYKDFLLEAKVVLRKKETLLAPEWQELLAKHGIARHQIEANIDCIKS